MKKIFPAMVPVSSGVVTGLRMAFYKLEHQAVHGLGPCSLQLRFAEDQLYEITFDCGRDDKVVAVLREHYGPPVQEIPQGTFWIGEKGGITLNPRSKTFAFVDMVMNRRVQAALLSSALRQQGRESPPDATPPPAAR